MAASKYVTLATFLLSQTESEITLPFASIEDILGFPLPPSARIHRPWWANDHTHTHAHSGWLQADWEVSNIDMTRQVVTFRRAIPSKASPAPHAEPISVTSLATGATAARRFQESARKTLSDYFGTDLRPRQLPPVPKLFDFVSANRQIVGDAKYYSMVRGQGIPPAKFSTISEHLWLLEKTKAQRKFLVFGNDRRVPERWLQRYGKLVTDVEFLFLDDQGHLTELR